MPDQRLEQFAHDLYQEVLARAGEDDDGNGNDRHRALREEMFTETVLELLDAHDEIEGWEICGYESKSVGSMSAAKLNAWALSGDGATLDLYVTLYHGTGQVEDVGKP